MKLLDDTASTATSLAHDAANRVAATVADAHDAAGRLGDAAHDGASGLARRAPGVDVGRRSRRWPALVPALVVIAVVAVLVNRKRRDTADDAAPNIHRPASEMTTGTTAADHGASVMRPDVSELTEAADKVTTGTGDSIAPGRTHTTTQGAR